MCIRRSIVKKFVTLLLLALSSWAVLADDLVQDQGPRFYGFIGQGFIYSTENNFFGNTDDQVDTDLREIGLGVTYGFTDKIHGALQLRSRKAGEGMDGSLEVDHGFLAYDQFIDEDSKVNFKLGLVKLPYGLFNESRDAPVARSSIILPQSIYNDRGRKLSAAQHGLRVDYTNGGFQLASVVGYPTQLDSGVEAYFYGVDRPGSLKDDGLSWIGRVSYDFFDTGLQLAYTRANAKIRYEAGIDPIGDGQYDLVFNILSLRKHFDSGELTAEYGRDVANSRGHNLSLLNLKDVERERWYVQYEHFFGPKWSGFVRYEESYNNRDDKDGLKTSALTFQPPWNYYSKAWGVGATYHINDNWMVMAEAYRVNGANWLNGVENNLYTTKKDWDMYMLEVAYSF